ERCGAVDPCHRSTPGQAGTSTAPGRGGRRLLFRQERRSGEDDGRQARVHSQSFQQKPRAQTRAEETLVPQWAKMADRMRGAHQRGKGAHGSRPLPQKRFRGNEPLGWPGHHRRNRRQHRPRDRKAIKAVGRPPPSKLSIRPPVNPAGNALRFSIDRRSQSAILRREVARTSPMPPWEPQLTSPKMLAMDSSRDMLEKLTLYFFSLWVAWMLAVWVTAPRGATSSAR